MIVQEVTDRQLEKEIEAAKAPLAVLFYRSVEPDSMILLELLDSFDLQYSERVIFKRIDVEENPDFTTQLLRNASIQGRTPYVPVLVLYRRQNVWGWVGCRQARLPKYIRQMLSDCIAERSP